MADITPIRDGVQVQSDRSVQLLERVTDRLAEFRRDFDEEPQDIVFVIHGADGTARAGWLIGGDNIRPVIALASVVLGHEAVA